MKKMVDNKNKQEEYGFILKMYNLDINQVIKIVKKTHTMDR